jgi:hypothetical protein
MTQQDRDRKLLLAFVEATWPSKVADDVTWSNEIVEIFFDLDQYRSIPSDTIDKTDPNLSNVSDK